MKNKNVLLFLTGLSGSGKGYFKNNILPQGLFYPLISMTTRPIREGEKDGIDYFFSSESDFENAEFVTYLDVNKDVRKEGDPKWLYGVSEQEFLSHRNQNLVYDVIQPRYILQMINWCRKSGFDFDFKILYFIQPNSGFDIAKSRVGMKDDLLVRHKNTSNYNDFNKIGLDIDWLIVNSVQEMIFDKNMIDFINSLSKNPITLDNQVKIIQDSKIYFKGFFKLS